MEINLFIESYTMKNLDLCFKAHPSSRYHIIKMQGKLESIDAINFKNQLCDNVEKFGSHCTLDLSQIDQADLTGLNALVISKRAFQRAGKTLQLNVKDSKVLSELAHLTKMNHFLAN